MKEQELKDIIHKYPDIMERNRFVWENRLSEKKVIMWLENFRGKFLDEYEEADLAMDLLFHFLYFSENELKYLCKVSVTLLKYQIMQSNPHKYLQFNSDFLISDCLKKNLYSYIGYLSESSSHFTYPLRQECDIPVSQFVEPDKLLDKTGVNCTSEIGIVFLDDFLGTGDIGCSFWQKTGSLIRKRNRDVALYYLALVGLKGGIDRIETSTGFKVICPFIIDNEYRVFDAVSNIFPNILRRTEARKMCTGYGKDLVGDRDALGYKDSQALVGLHHNIPDNTLPVIWNDHEWFPIFKREKKRI